MFMMSQGEEKDLERTMKNWAFSERLNFRSILKKQWLQAIICEFFQFVFFTRLTRSAQPKQCILWWGVSPLRQNFLFNISDIWIFNYRLWRGILASLPIHSSHWLCSITVNLLNIFLALFTLNMFYNSRCYDFIILVPFLLPSFWFQAMWTIL